MSIENVGVAAVVVNGQVSAILLEDIACCCFAVAACELSYMAAAEATVCFAPNLIIPGCAVIQVHIDNALEGFGLKVNIFSKSNTGQGGFIIRQADINYTVDILVVVIRSGGAVSLQITVDNSSVFTCCSLVSIHININVTYISQ